MTVVKGLLLGVLLSVIYSVVYLYYRMYQGPRANPPGTALHLFEARYWVGVVGMLLIGCAIVWYWSSGASMWIVSGHLIDTGLIVKGTLLGTGLFLVTAVAYFVRWIRSVAPGSPVGTDETKEGWDSLQLHLSVLRSDAHGAVRRVARKSGGSSTIGDVLKGRFVASEL